MNASPLELIRSFLKQNKVVTAEGLLKSLMEESFSLKIKSVNINQDGYSLNSANGWVTTDEDKKFFFKFHQEENEEETLQEYYRADLLEKAGYDVDKPVYCSTEVGKQILLYQFKDEQRLADVCYDLDKENAIDPQVVLGQEKLDQKVFDLYSQTYHKAEAHFYEKEPVLQLFYWRLLSNQNREKLAGRVQSFYMGKQLTFPHKKQGIQSYSFNDLWQKKWIINGIEYKQSLKDLFLSALNILSPENIMKQGSYPAVISHGDAHNANVWFNPNQYIYFDPAFAGSHIHALLAEIKPTFHNIFAHPFWLYSPDDCQSKYNASFDMQSDKVIVEHDWALTPLREKFLEVKAKTFWKPWLAFLHQRNTLPNNWEEFMRTALFCCPTLVMNLCANHGVHNPLSSLLGFCIAIQVGSKPQANQSDGISQFFDEITPKL